MVEQSARVAYPCLCKISSRSYLQGGNLVWHDPKAKTKEGQAPTNSVLYVILMMIDDQWRTPTVNRESRTFSS